VIDTLKPKGMEIGSRSRSSASWSKHLSLYIRCL